MSYICVMTVQEVLNDKAFNKGEISKHVFGNQRIISDKTNGHRNKRWLPGDFKKISEYLKKKYGIICE